MKDHVELGKALDLFIQSPLVGKGLPLFTPRGSAIRRELIRFVETTEIKQGYEYTTTPFMADEDLYKVSGHWDLYQDNMFKIPSKEEKGSYLALRPMTCPFQFQIYKRKTHSYKDLPVRYGETSYLFRNEAGGAIHGLIRTRQFTLSEGHIICRPDQIETEFLDALKLVRFIMQKIGLTGFWYRFSKYDPNEKGKYIDNPEAWESSQALLKQILDKTGEPYVEAEGEAAFYGPKLDIQLRDAWGRDETLFTLQLDFALPPRFEMVYLDDKGKECTPMVIHRSSIGCYERTMALLLEQYQGRLPFWIAPEQIRVILVNSSVVDYANKLIADLAEMEIRVTLDAREETLSKKIVCARELLVPVILILGDKEKRDRTISVRKLEGSTTDTVSYEAFLEKCAQAKKDQWILFE